MIIFVIGGVQLKTSESDVYRHQILMAKVDPHTEMSKIFIYICCRPGTYGRYEAERANQDIYDDYKMK